MEETQPRETSYDLLDLFIIYWLGRLPPSVSAVQYAPSVMQLLFFPTDSLSWHRLQVQEDNSADEKAKRRLVCVCFARADLSQMFYSADLLVIIFSCDVFHAFTQWLQRSVPGSWSLVFAGYGLHCHRAVITLCKLIGIKDMYCKVDGSVNLLNITRALFTGLAKQVRSCWNGSKEHKKGKVK